MTTGRINQVAIAGRARVPDAAIAPAPREGARGSYFAHQVAGRDCPRTRDLHSSGDAGTLFPACLHRRHPLIKPCPLSNDGPAPRRAASRIGLSVFFLGARSQELQERAAGLPLTGADSQDQSG